MWALKPWIEPELQSFERNILDLPLRGLSLLLHADANGCADGADALLWALRMRPEPPEFGRSTLAPVEAEAILAKLDGATFVTLLRPQSEIEALRSRYHLMRQCQGAQRLTEVMPPEGAIPWDFRSNLARVGVSFTREQEVESLRATRLIPAEKRGVIGLAWLGRIMALDWICGVRPAYWLESGD